MQSVSQPVEDLYRRAYDLEYFILQQQILDVHWGKKAMISRNFRMFQMKQNGQSRMDANSSAKNHWRSLAFIRGFDHGKRTREELTLNPTRPSPCFGGAGSPGAAFVGAPIPTASSRAEPKPHDRKKLRTFW